MSKITCLIKKIYFFKTSVYDNSHCETDNILSQKMLKKEKFSKANTSKKRQNFCHNMIHGEIA